MENSLFDMVKAALRPRLETVLRDLLPGGAVKGREYVCGSVGGGSGDSCKTNLRTGVGSDFATGEKWGDIIALTALVMNCGQEEAARFLADEYHIDTGKPRAPARKSRATGKAAARANKSAFVPIMPIPDSAPDFPEQYRTGPRWCYRNADGMELYYSFRLDKPDGSKDFVPLCFCRDPKGHYQWVAMAPTAPRPLYGLDRLAKAAPDAPILLVEGEKTADAAQAIFPGHVCMTWMGGSNAADKTDYSPLGGRNVTIWPDNDAPGIKAAVALVGILYDSGAAEVRLVYPPDLLPEKWDLADPVPGGFDPRGHIADALDRDDFLRAVRCRHGETELGAVAIELLAEAEGDFEIPMYPELSRETLPGFVGEFVDLATRDSEADQAAVLVTLLVRFGAEVYGHQKGKGPYLAIGEAIHPPRVFAVVCGNSSKARKGTSKQPVMRLFKRDLCDPEELARLNLPPSARESGGPLSTGEGLAFPLRENAQDDGGGRDPGDKRLCVMDEELASGLSCTKREGNTLSMAIRTFWDDGDYAPLTKTNPMQVKGAHICLLSHITKTELDLSLTSVNMVNGFGNRILWICARRSKSVALPRPMPHGEIAALQWRLWQLVAQAQNTGEMYLTSAAVEEWKRLYPELSAETAGLTGAVTSRAEAQTMRLALLYALLDGKQSIDTPHINAAVALWRYAQASAAILFHDRAVDRTEQKILAALQGGGCTTTMLNKALGGHVGSAKIWSVIASLQAANKVSVRHEKTGGNKRTIIALCGKSGLPEKAENAE